MLRAEVDRAGTLDVVVVGAGPAGAAAALSAARRGARVRLLERHRFPRDKTCGDGLTAAALRHLEELGVPLPTLPSVQPVHEVVLVSPSGRRVTLPMPGDGWHATVVPRADLDQLVVRTAVAAGVELVEGFEVTGVHAADGTVTVVGADGRRCSARFLVAADGPWSRLRRAVDGDTPADGRGGWMAFRQYASGVTDDRLWVWFTPELLPGYAWVFPLPGGRANVGFGLPRDRTVTGRVLARRWRQLWDGPFATVLGPGAQPEDRARAWPIPTTFTPGRLSTGRVLFAGDAAGVVDPMTGEGIAQALATGIAAGRAVTDPALGDDPDAVAGRYRRAVRRDLGADLQFARALGAVLRHSWAARGALAAVDAGDWTRRCFARWMFEDYPRAVLLTPRRWRPGVFRPPGAWRGAPGVLSRDAAG